MGNDELPGHLAGLTPSWWDQFRLLDSTPVPCGASRETVERSALAGWATCWPEC